MIPCPLCGLPQGEDYVNAHLILGHGFAGGPGAPGAIPGIASARPESSASSGRGAPSGAGDGSAPARPPKAPFVRKAIEKKPLPKEVEGAFYDLVARFKNSFVELEKPKFYRLLDAQREAGVQGKLKDVIDKIPPDLLYPVFVEIGLLGAPGAAKAVVEMSDPASSIGDCYVCGKPATVTRQDATGVTRRVCDEDAAAIDARKAERERARK